MIKFILFFVILMHQEIVQNVTLLGSFLLILYLFMKTSKNIFRQVYLDNCAYEIAGKQMRDYLNKNLYETDKGQLFGLDKWAL